MGRGVWRVPVAGSRAFVEAAKALEKVVTYVEVEGQGHHVEGRGNFNERAFQRMRVSRFDRGPDVVVFGSSRSSSSRTS